MKRPSVWFYVGLVAAALVMDAVLPLLVALGAGLLLALGARWALVTLPVMLHPVPVGAGVVVTGASRGFGRRFALSLARSGYVVYATVRKEEDGRALVDEYAAWRKQQQRGRGDVRPVICDVSKKQDVVEAARWVERDAERDGLEVKAVINNAGVQRLGPLETVDDAYLRHGFDVNFFGALDVTRVFLPHLRRWQERYHPTSHPRSFFRHSTLLPSPLLIPLVMQTKRRGWRRATGIHRQRCRLGFPPLHGRVLCHQGTAR
jgi:NAD(P)-dependent dehydrogenase (short-subunit alcohol dehydrogenase family)